MICECRPGRVLRILLVLVALVTVSGAFGKKQKKLDCTLDSGLYNYTLNKVQTAKIALKPFPHVYIKDIFKPSFYPCILNKLPDGTVNHADSPYSKDKSQRYLVKLMGRAGQPLLDTNDRDFSEAAAQAIDFKWWSDFGQLLATRELARAWVKLFDTTTGRRYNETATPTIKWMYRMELSRDMSGYRIGPHTDTDKKWVTTLYYLPSTAKHAGVGTSILRNKNGRVQRAGTKHYTFGPEWETAFRAPFVPNTVMAFAPCYHSWHAVETMTERVMRDTLQGFVTSSIGTKKGPCGG
mmetsp:Transcript_10109/g.21074  ORF Transcript_10109/g.21074 Transcript_10109/m.21074 type:complete len:295 (-) Transcript_10109:427-1311(-)